MKMINLPELHSKGWTLVEGINSKAELLELGRSIGTPTRTPNGELIKEIRRSTANEAPIGSQSAIYGTSRFPLHTDTVFWPIPTQYLILRGSGDCRRPTTIMSFRDMLQKCGMGIPNLLQESVWRVSAGRHNFYCSISFRQKNQVGWRYDADLMTPANEAAAKAHKMLKKFVKSEETETIYWSGSTAAILCNWATLHGRGNEPSDEGERIIERLYVR